MIINIRGNQQTSCIKTIEVHIAILLPSPYNNKLQVLRKSNDFEDLVFMVGALINERTIPQVQEEYPFSRIIRVENST